jgi:surface carbohydrate biosynthesis protein
MNILFPIETISRELDYKLLLAFELAGKNNRKVHFGNFKFLDRLLPYFYGGLYIGKNIFRNDARKYKPKGYYDQKKRDIDTVYYFEEGAFFYDREELIRSLLAFSCDPKVFDKDDYVFVWGRRQEGILKETTNFPENVKNVGIIRFDMYRDYKYLYKKEHSIKVRDFILINTHNAFSNNHNAFTKFTEFYKFSEMDIDRRSEFYSKLQYDFSNLTSMIQLIFSLLKKHPELDFVIRPHPSENLDYYKLVFQNIPNVKVIREGSVGEWLSDAKAMIHGGCTTSFEGHFYGVPVITYINDIDEKYSIYPANSIGYIVDNEEKVGQLLDLILKGDKPGDHGFKYHLKGDDVINNLLEPSLPMFVREYDIIEEKYLSNPRKFSAPSRGKISCSTERINCMRLNMVKTSIRASTRNISWIISGSSKRRKEKK